MPQDNKLSALGFGPEARDSILEALQRMINPQAQAPAESLLFPTQNEQGDQTFFGRHTKIRRGLEAGLFSLAQPVSAANQQDPLGGIRHGLQGLFGYQQALEQKPLLGQGQADERTLTAAKAIGSLGAQGADAAYKQALMGHMDDPTLGIHQPTGHFYSRDKKGNVTIQTPEDADFAAALGASQQGGGEDMFERWKANMRNSGDADYIAIANDPVRALEMYGKISSGGRAKGAAGAGLGLGTKQTIGDKNWQNRYDRDYARIMKRLEPNTTGTYPALFGKAVAEGKVSIEGLESLATEMREMVAEAAQLYQENKRRNPKDTRTFESFFNKFLINMANEETLPTGDLGADYLDDSPAATNVPRNNFLPEMGGAVGDNSYATDKDQVGAITGPVPAALRAHAPSAAPALGPVQGPAEFEGHNAIQRFLHRFLRDMEGRLQPDPNAKGLF